MHGVHALPDQSEVKGNYPVVFATEAAIVIQLGDARATELSDSTSNTLSANMSAQGQHFEAFLMP